MTLVPLTPRQRAEAKVLAAAKVAWDLAHAVAAWREDAIHGGAAIDVDAAAGVYEALVEVLALVKEARR